jgi:hypothetical protein
MYSGSRMLRLISTTTLRKDRNDLSELSHWRNASDRKGNKAKTKATSGLDLAKLETLSSDKDGGHWRNASNGKANKVKDKASCLGPAKFEALSSDKDGGPPVFDSTATIVIQITGEMANHLC